MSAREAFGPNLRRIRLQRGITLEQIAAATKVATALWDGLERNDLKAWPTGIYARSFVRDYARAIGADPEATVDEFCRWFEHGDRRVEPGLRVHAQIVNHDLAWKDNVPPPIEGDRRGSPSTSPGARLKKASVPFSWLRGIVRTPR